MSTNASTLSSWFYFQQETFLSQAQLNDKHLLHPALDQHSIKRSSNTRSHSLYATVCSMVRGMVHDGTQLVFVFNGALHNLLQTLLTSVNYSARLHE